MNSIFQLASSFFVGSSERKAIVLSELSERHLRVHPYITSRKKEEKGGGGGGGLNICDDL